MPRKKKENLFPGYIRIQPPNQVALGYLTRDAIGKKRTLTEFAADCGLAPSTVSRIVNAKFVKPISDGIIFDIAQNADPESGVTLDDLLRAHGLAKINVIDVPDTDKPITNILLAQGPVEIKKGSISPSNILIMPGNHDIQFDAHYGSGKSSFLSSLMSGMHREIIQNSLLNLGYRMQLTADSTYTSISLCTLAAPVSFTYQTDAVASDGLETWTFEVHESTQQSLEKQLAMVFSTAYLTHPSTEKIKISILTTDSQGYNRIKQKFSEISIQDCISIILINFSGETVLEEFIFHREGWPDHPSIFDVHT